MDDLYEELLDDEELLDEDFLSSLEDGVSEEDTEDDSYFEDSDFGEDTSETLVEEFVEESDLDGDTSETLVEEVIESSDVLEDNTVLDLDLDKAEELGETEVPKDDDYNSSVERYTATHITYPCISLCGRDTLPNHTLQAVRKMIDSSRSSHKSYDFYYQQHKLGTISSKQVKALVELVGRDNLEAYFSKGFVLEDDLIYTLCD